MIIEYELKEHDKENIGRVAVTTRDEQGFLDNFGVSLNRPVTVEKYQAPSMISREIPIRIPSLKYKIKVIDRPAPRKPHKVIHELDDLIICAKSADIASDISYFLGKNDISMDKIQISWLHLLDSGALRPHIYELFSSINDIFKNGVNKNLSIPMVRINKALNIFISTSGDIFLEEPTGVDFFNSNLILYLNINSYVSGAKMIIKDLAQVSASILVDENRLKKFDSKDLASKYNNFIAVRAMDVA